MTQSASQYYRQNKGNLELPLGVAKHEAISALKTKKAAQTLLKYASNPSCVLVIERSHSSYVFV